MTRSSDARRPDELVLRAAPAPAARPTPSRGVEHAVPLPYARDEAPASGDADRVATSRLRDAVERVLTAPRDPSAVDMLQHAVGAHAQAMARLGLSRQATVDALRTTVGDVLEECRTRPSSAVVALVLWRGLGWALGPTA